MVIGGTKRTLVWDDLNPQQRVSVYDRGVDIAEVSQATAPDARAAQISYRLGDTWAPALAEGEALAGVAAEFAAAIVEGRGARTSGDAGLRGLGVLEAAAISSDGHGVPTPLVPEFSTVRGAAA
jgi:predicted dehydrogenase